MAFNTAHFSRMPQSRKPHTRFKKPFCHGGTMDHGDIVPVYAKLVAPGDIINERIIGNIRLSTPIAPLYSSIKLSFNAFFVPLRLIWANCKKFFGENDSSAGPQTTTYYVPTYPLNITGSNGTQVKVGTVSHYLGKPLYKGNTLDGAVSTQVSNPGVRVSILKERAYWLCINEWYRHEQIQNPIIVDTTDTGAATLDGRNFNSACQKCLKDFDYFTTCTISPTYTNTPVTMPIATSNSLAPVIASGSFLHDMSEGGISSVRFGTKDKNISAGYARQLLVENYTTGTLKDGILVSGSGAAGIQGNADHDFDITSSNLFAKLSLAATADISQLYLAMAANAWFYNSNFGSRYFEMLQVHYGVTNPDLVLSRPEHIGEKKIYLAMSQVLSTAGASNDATTKLGQPGANSSTDFNFNIFNKSFGEWGIVLILANTYHERYYSAGVDREDLYTELFDFYFPEFANIGDQAVKKAEVFYSSTRLDQNLEAFGYQEAWAEMRYSNNRLSGLLDPYAESGVNSSQNALVGWTLGEKLSAVPQLNSTFIRENRNAIEEALVTGSNGPDYVFYMYFDEKATRELPLYSVPGLPGRGRGII